MKANNEYNGHNLNDWVIYCDICGRPCMASQATILDTYTGRGGLMVCPDDNDPIDPGLVPYKVPPEQPVPNTRINHYATDPSNVPNSIEPFNAQTTDPMSISNPEDEL